MTDETPPQQGASSVPGAPGGEGGETTGVFSDSAPRRTWLAAERTYLAWLRTGLGALGLALAISLHIVHADIAGNFGNNNRVHQSRTERGQLPFRVLRIFFKKKICNNKT